MRCKREVLCVLRHAAAFPALFITGQKPILKSKQGAFQIVDIVSMLRPITKFAKQVCSPASGGADLLFCGLSLFDTNARHYSLSAQFVHPSHRA